MFTDIQLPEWLQWAILAGAGVLAVWLFIVLVVIYQTALDHADFLMKERERLGHTPINGTKELERWDATH